MKRFFTVGLLLVLFISFTGCQMRRQLMFEWPKVSKEDVLICHSYYSLVYDETYELPTWTAYCLTGKETYPYVSRSYNYLPDPDVMSGTAVYNDYKKSGYDRGHLIPARDMMFDQLAQKEVNYMSNISPQKPEFNRGIWRVLERNVRKWANQYDSVMVVTGPVFTDSLPVIGKENTVSVPESFYKVVLVYNDTLQTGIAFQIPNDKQTDKNIFEFAITIDSLENVVPIDFFPKLPRKYKHVEDTVVLSDWKN